MDGSSLGLHSTQMVPETRPPQFTGSGLNNISPEGLSGDSALSEALAVLRKRQWIVIACLILGLLYGIYKSATQPILYTAVGRILVRNSSTASEYSVGAAVSGQADNQLETAVLVITSDSLLLSVAKEMNLQNNPDFMGFDPRLPARVQDLSDPAVRFGVLGRMNAAVQVALIPRTQIIRITCITPKAQMSADIINHLINAFQQRSYESRFQSTQRVSQWLQSQLDDLKQQVESSQEKLIDLQKRLGVLGLNFDGARPTTASAASVDALVTAAGKAKVDRILAESRYRVLNSSDPNLLESNLDANGGQSQLSRLRTDAAETRATIAQDSVTLGPKNPQILALQAHLHEVERELLTEQTRLLTESKQALVAAQANEKETAAALEQQKNEAFQLRDQVVEYTLRQRDYEANRTLYESLLSRLRAASVQAGLDSVEIDIVDPAYRPASITSVSRSSILAKTVTVGLIAGLMLAFTLESLDTGIRSVAELESVTQLPSLSVIPRVRRLAGEAATEGNAARINLGVLAASNSQFSEAFRSLRTSLLLARTGKPPRIVVITSSTPTEGKTTVSTNLAVILAQSEARVLLIDGDLRRPNVHHRFGVSGRSGLSTVLSGGTSFEDALQRIPEVPNLDLLCSGPVPPFPAEMLSSEAMQQLLKQCAETYTHVVIDTPPILSVTDGVILSRFADAVVLVVRYGKSSRNVVRRSRELLARSGAAMTGVVLNAVDISAPEYRGYYGYSGYSKRDAGSKAWKNGTDPLDSGKGEQV
ncbi:MAG: GumC family protein [Janthinobacterium lividum]